MPVPPLVDLTLQELWILKHMRLTDFAAFIGDVERDGWDVARNSLVRYSPVRAEPQENLTEEEWTHVVR